MNIRKTIFGTICGLFCMAASAQQPAEKRTLADIIDTAAVKEALVASGMTKTLVYMDDSTLAVRGVCDQKDRVIESYHAFIITSSGDTAFAGGVRAFDVHAGGPDTLQKVWRADKKKVTGTVTMELDVQTPDYRQQELTGHIFLADGKGVELSPVKGVDAGVIWRAIKVAHESPHIKPTPAAPPPVKLHTL